MESVERVEIYVEPVLVTLEPVQNRIGKRNTKMLMEFLCFLGIFYQYFAFFSGKGGLGKNWSLESIELVEFYLEPVRTILESV
jgi:hypothetical protein